MKKILIILLIMVSFIFAQRHHRINPAVENYRVYKMTNDLELTPEQSQQFFPMLRSHMIKIRTIEDKISDLDKKVNSDNSIDEKEYSKIKNNLIKLENDKLNEKSQFLNDLENILEPKQIAKYLFFDRKFRRGLQRRLKDMRR